MNYQDLVPASSFIGQYLALYSGIETAQAYDFWSAVWSISHVVNRRVLINRPMSPLRINHYLVFVSEPGVGRKSTAIGHARSLMQSFDSAVAGTSSQPLPRLLTGSTTPEQFESVLADMSFGRVSIAISEMARFIGVEKYKLGLVPLLVDLYDCPDRQEAFGTKKGMEYALKEVFINFITGCTPEWLSTAVSPAVLEGGFASRALFIAQDRGKATVAWPQETDTGGKCNDLHRLLLHHLDEATHQGNVELSPGAINAYSTWYTHRKGAATVYQRHFESREHDHMLKLAAVLCINDGAWEVQAQHIQTALRIIEETKTRACALFVEGTAVEIKAVTGIEKIRDRLHKALPDHIGHRALYTMVRQWMSIEQFKNVISIMHELNMIEVYQDPSTHGRYYKGTRHLTGPAKLQSLVRKASKT